MRRRRTPAVGWRGLSPGVGNLSFVVYSPVKFGGSLPESLENLSRNVLGRRRQTRASCQRAPSSVLEVQQHRGAECQADGGWSPGGEQDRDLRRQAERKHDIG